MPRHIRLSLLSMLTFVALAAPGPQRAWATNTRHIVYVSISDLVPGGAKDGHYRTWTQILSRQLPHGARVVDLGADSNTVTSALTRDVPVTLRSHPTLITVDVVWHDLLADHTPPATYARTIDRLLARLQRTGARVFVANVPDMRKAPASAYPGGGAQYARPALEYNKAIAGAAARHGAVVVDMYANTKLLYPHPELYDPTYGMPTTRGNAVLAGIFYRTMHQHGAL